MKNMTLRIAILFLFVLVFSCSKKDDPKPPPTISAFSPLGGGAGTTVTITGTNFSTTPSANTVSFNGTASIVTASTATSITTTVPTAATKGTIAVMVNGLTATSTASFTTLIGVWKLTGEVITNCTATATNGTFTCNTSCPTVTFTSTTITFLNPGGTPDVYNYFVSGTGLVLTQGSYTETDPYSIAGTLLTLVFQDSVANGSCTYTITWSLT